MRPLIILIILLLSNNSWGQNFSYLVINTNGHIIVDFIPSGWTLFDSAYGDFNHDNRDDAVIILQKRDAVLRVNSEDDSVLTQLRLLLILFKDSMDNKFYLKEQSTTFILPDNNPNRSDPYQEIKINKGILKISFQLFYNSGGWYITSSSYKFRYQDNQFYLIGADYSSFHRARQVSQEYSYNFLSKRRSLIKMADGVKVKRMKTWKYIDSPELKTLKTFTQPFSWDIEEEVLL